MGNIFGIIMESSNKVIIKMLLSGIFFSVKVIGAEFAEQAATTIHVLAIEETAFIARAPFKEQIDVFGRVGIDQMMESLTAKLGENANALTECDADAEEAREHGVMVSSLLVGEWENRLPIDTKLLMTSGISNVKGALDSVRAKQKDLVVINWSGLESFPGLPPELEMQIEAIPAYFSFNLEAVDQAQFMRNQEEVKDSFEALISAIAGVPSASAIELCARKAIEIANEALHLCAEGKWDSIIGRKEVWIQAITDQVSVIKDQLSQKSRQKFIETKECMLSVLAHHPNILIVWALGNDGMNIDESSSWQEIFQGNDLIDHCLLVSGTGSSARHSDSNYTISYAAHGVSASFNALVWDLKRKRQVREGGTSFAAPRVTVEAYKVAQGLLRETGILPTFTDVKAKLVGKVYR